ncbi:MAG: thioredoxin family protein [Armatimonadetes bacterium]|jgi:thioredoxin 1|nr:thioredoxin family protein [Armatimonadota bacterium]MDI9601727.1 thioredoxin family protein [Acidobacteriota bacterium]NLN88574.1 thioredoxin family protein [candidate division WS1 bacterium]
MSKAARISIVAVVALAVVGVLVAKGSRAPADGAVVTSGLPTLLELGSTKCIPCKQMAPILDELSRDYEGVFAVELIDVYEHPSAAEHYGVSIIPTQVFLDADGNELFRHTGFYAKADILAKWAEFGVGTLADGADG